jgi:type III secretion system YscQ/HrcQ family protein
MRPLREPPLFLRRLKKYSASEVLINNAYRRAFLDLSSWSSWIEEALRELLQVPGGSEVHVTLRNELDSEQAQTLVFAQREISVGRAAENDISLPLQSISRHHARIFEKDGDLFVEDLHSVSGTYLNRRRLAPTLPCRLVAGDEVLMFPYVLQIEPRDIWNTDETLQVSYSSESAVLDAEQFASHFGSETCLLRLSIRPQLPHMLLAISRSLAETIIARLLRKSDIAFVESDRELLEFIVACVLERANRVLHFPFECSLTAFQENELCNETGLTLEAFVRLSEARGCVRLFVPDVLLQKLPQPKTALRPWMKSSLKWHLLLRIGSADLDTQDLEQMEQGDIVLYRPRCDFVLPTGNPGGTQRGWLVTRDESNAHRFSIKDFYQWSTAMATDEMHQEMNSNTGVSDLSNLPVRMHVVLGSVEMDLEGLESLQAGSIVQLDADTSGAVQLVVGDTVLGSGDLVELEGDRLGVQITKWRER